MNLTHLLQDVTQVGDTFPDLEITGLALDSRKVIPGDLFLAASDKYIEEAVRRGARAILYSGTAEVPAWREATPILRVALTPDTIAAVAARFNDYPASQMQLIGVTGTSGKTSCTQFLASALRRPGQPCGVIGTLGMGCDGSLQPAALTTPDALTLHAAFASFLHQGVKRTCMEVSSHALHQGRVAGLRFAVGVFTNLSRDHLDYHKDMAEYGAQKKKLFDQSEVSVINVNDAFGRSCLPMTQPFVACGTDHLAGDFLQSLPPASRVMATHVQLHGGSFTAGLETPWGNGNLCVSLPGFFNVENALLVLATLCTLGIPFGEALGSLGELRPVPGRMQTFGGEGLPEVIVDYAHKPDALLKVLATLREKCRGRLYCVFGCGGNRDMGKRPLMGEVAARYADKVIVTDDNPRYEDPKVIVQEILEGIPAGTDPIVIHDRCEAIWHAVKEAGPDDIVLVAGKGHENVQYRREEVLPFSDAKVAEEVLHWLRQRAVTNQEQ